MIQYYLTALKKYADFSGRARRSEYWYFVLGNFIINILFTILNTVFGNPESLGIISILSIVFQLFTFIPSLAAGVRRMHDVGKSGWFILIPIYNLILLFTEGQKGSNEYGPDPKDENSGYEIKDVLDSNI